MLAVPPVARVLVLASACFHAGWNLRLRAVPDRVWIGACLVVVSMLFTALG